MAARIYIRVNLFALLLLLTLACISPAQDGVSTAGAARTRYLGKMGIIPASREVVVEDFVNYHRHEIARPKAGDAVALDVRWGGEAVSSGHSEVLQVGLSTTLAHERDQLRPLNLALVIDKSGSMADDNKLVRVKEAVATLIGKLRPSDMLSLVAFDSDAQVLYPAQAVGDGQAAKAILRSLEPGSSTNLNAGLMLGYQEASRHYRKEATNRVILLTDGIANRGVTDPKTIAQGSMSYNDRGIDLSTIGVGLDLNKDLLRELAKSGRGLFHFVADSADIDKVFVKEVQSLVSPVATEPNLEIEFGHAFLLDKVYGYAPKVQGGSIGFKLDNLNSGMTEVVLLRLKPNADQPGGSRLPVRVRLSYFDLGRNKEVVMTETSYVTLTQESKSNALEDGSVAKNYTIALLAQAIHDMAMDCESARFAEAEDCLDAAVSESYGRYPHLEDEDIKRTLSMAVQYQSVLAERNGKRNAKEEDSDRQLATGLRNLIPNGDFALGNCGFMSDLAYIAPADNCLWPMGYTVAPSFLNPKLHTLIASQEFPSPKRPNGNEQVLYANAGDPHQLTIWRAKVKCKPNTRYRLSFQAVSLTPGLASIPTFEVWANSDRSDAQTAAEGAYVEISTTWESRSANSATISIVRLPMPQNGRLIGIANIEMVECPIVGRR